MSPNKPFLPEVALVRCFVAVMRKVSLHSGTSRFSWEPCGGLIDASVWIDAYKKGKWDALFFIGKSPAG